MEIVDACFKKGAVKSYIWVKNGKQYWLRIERNLSVEIQKV